MPKTEIKQGDIVTQGGTTTYTVESLSGDMSYCTVTNLATGKSYTRKVENLELVMTLEDLINKRMNGINCTSDRRRIVASMDELTDEFKNE